MPPGFKVIPTNVETTDLPSMAPAHPVTSHEHVKEFPVKEALKVNEIEVLEILRQYLTKEQRDNPKIFRFIMSYMACRDQAQAAREADMPGKGWYLRSRPEIHAAIEALTNKAVMKYGYDASEIIERVKEIGVIDPIEFENPDGSFKTHLSQIEPGVRRAIKKFKCKNLYGKDANGMPIVIGQLVDVELYDKTWALEALGTEKDVMKKTTRVEHDVTKRMADVLLESGNRADERMGRSVVEITGRVDETDKEGGAGDEGRQVTDVPLAE